MTPNEAALSRNAAVSPPIAMSSPAIAGPITKARLSRLDQALLAGPSSRSSVTRLGRYEPIVGPEEGREAGRQDGQANDRGERTVGRLEDGQREHDHAPGDVRHEQDQAPVEAIGDDPGGDRQEDVGQDPGGPDDAQQDRVRARLVDEDEERHEVQPVADRGHELAAEQPDERAVAEEPAIGGEDAHGVRRAGWFPSRASRAALISRSASRSPNQPPP